jgi:hypothetical protein
LLLLSLLLLPNLVFRTTHGVREVLMIDLPLFFGTTLSIASFYLTSEREVARMSGSTSHSTWGTLAQIPLVLSLGIGLCVNQTRAVMEAVFGRETEFVRTPKHGIKGKLETWSGKKYRAAKSLTPFFELLMAAYFVAAVQIAFSNGHYVSVPFLLLFLFGFGYVGALSAWQGGFGQSLRKLWQREEESLPMLPTPLVVAMPDATPAPILLPTMGRPSPRPARVREGNDHHERAAV